MALYTGQARDISGSLPIEVRGHALARLHDVEWVFEKQDADAASAIISLAQGVERLPGTWPTDPEEALAELRGLLNLGSEAYAEAAWDDVLTCHPPVHELSEASHTLALLRWLAHRILPYPTFLIDEFHLATALYLDPQTLSPLLGKASLEQAIDSSPLPGNSRRFHGCSMVACRSR